MKTYTLRPRLPLRAFVVAAALSLVGALVAVMGSAQGWHVAVSIIGLVLLGLGVLLAAGALLSLRTMRTLVDVDDDGYHIHGPGVDKHGQWSDVTRAALADDGARLVFSHGEVQRTHLWSPLGAADPDFKALVDDVVTRLDKSRGYRNIV
ncbi:hypothetical protein ACQB6R_01020 [Propionibacteriaceae bacterium G1746]|uniref:hypothetical protein n=1 Tax=Aestuariimicrobium sp. G57 TaxID=3418485 RepID=UPI003C26FED8